MIIKCLYCKDEYNRPDELVDFICSSCTLKLAAIAEQREEEEKKQYTGDMLKVLRKEKGWTQEVLALHLNIPKYKVTQFETGEILCPRPILAWMKQRETK
jgi:DNA-binding transcriptional regulator YiaG